MHPMLKQPDSSAAMLDTARPGISASKNPSAREGPARPVREIRPHRGLFDLDLGSVWRYRELLHFLVLRELKVRYKQAALGAAWVIMQPLFTLAIFTAVFGVFARIPSDGIPYALFALAAVIPWTYFSEALRRSSTGLLDDSELIRKIYFPRLVLPLAAVIAPVVDFLISLGVLVLVMAWYRVPPTIHLLIMPAFLAMAVGLALAFGLWLGPLNVRYRDIKHILPFFVQVWMYASPVVYPLSMVPERWRLLYSLNPMVGIIEGFRWTLLGTTTPNSTAIAITIALTLVFLAGGLIFFRRAERTFADVI
ncbi:MAG: Transport permease protein [Gammaproteobacteria bacterium]|nr:Transport permease protein [Gammaproteobacteria bacterium]